MLLRPWLAHTDGLLGGAVITPAPHTHETVLLRWTTDMEPKRRPLLVGS